jgi:hypothetical protein
LAIKKVLGKKETGYIYARVRASACHSIGEDDFASPILRVTGICSNYDFAEEFSPSLPSSFLPPERQMPHSGSKFLITSSLIDFLSSLTCFLDILP